MRKIASFLCVLMVFSLLGCTGKDNLNLPVAFYYPVVNIDHNNTQKVFDKEIRECAEFSDNIVLLLNEYVKGPENENLYNPFPMDGRIVDSKREGNVLTLHLSEQFSSLALNKLSLSIACLAQTVFAYTSAPVLVLIPNGTFIDGSTYRTFTADSFIYSDRNTNYSSPQ